MKKICSLIFAGLFFLCFSQNLVIEQIIMFSKELNYLVGKLQTLEIANLFRAIISPANEEVERIEKTEEKASMDEKTDIVVIDAGKQLQDFLAKFRGK